MGTPSLLCIFLMYGENTMALSLPKDHVKRELVCTLPIAAMKPATVIRTMKIVAAVLDPVAWNQISYIGTLPWTSALSRCTIRKDRDQPSPRTYGCLDILYTIEHGYCEEEGRDKPDNKAITDGAGHSSGWIKAVFRQMNSAVKTSEAVVGVDQTTQENESIRLPTGLIDELVPYVVVGLLRFSKHQTGNAYHKE